MTKPRVSTKPEWLASQEGNCSSCQAPFSTYQAGGQYHDTGLCTTCALSPNGPLSGTSADFWRGQQVAFAAVAGMKSTLAPGLVTWAQAQANLARQASERAS